MMKNGPGNCLARSIIESFWCSFFQKAAAFFIAGAMK